MADESVEVPSAESVPARSGRDPIPTGIGVALSGGGHRATVWGLGALLALVDAGRNRDVVAISSVSGGSIANGVVAQNCDYRDVDPNGFREAVRPLLRHIAFEGLFFWGRATNAYVISILVTLGLGALLVLDWLLRALIVGRSELPWWEHLLGVLGVVLIAAGGFLFSRRSLVVDRALAKVHYSRGGVATPLSAVARGLDHVFCATDLQTGRHFYMAPTFVTGYDYGVGAPARTRLSTAVQCSACLPGAFAPRSIPLAPFGLRGAPPAAPGETGWPPEALALVDGGVYDNMGDQWLVGLADRRRRWAEAGLSVDLRGEAVSDVVIANSGGTYRRHRVSGLGLPGVGDLRVFQRVSSVMYSVTTTHRRQQFVRRSRLAERLGEGQRGALVHILQSPFDVAKAFARGDDAYAQRARAVLRLLDGQDEAAWERRAAASAQVPTVLRKLGATRTVDLLEHVYVLTQCNLHVLLGYPLVEALPDRASFEKLLLA